MVFRNPEQANLVSNVQTLNSQLPLNLLRKQGVYQTLEPGEHARYIRNLKKEGYSDQEIFLITGKN